jgi:hypothetical protein
MKLRVLLHRTNSPGDIRCDSAAARRGWRRWLTVALAPALAAGTSVVPVAAAVTAGGGLAAVAAMTAPAPAQAASGSVLTASDLYTVTGGTGTASLSYGAIGRVLQSAARTGGIESAAATWWDYETSRPESRLSGDIDYDFSAKMAGEMEKAGEKAAKVIKYLQVLTTLLGAFLSHSKVALVVGIVASLLAVALINVKKLVNIVKVILKGKGKHTGFYVVTFEALGVSQRYESYKTRSCTALSIACGSPGKIVARG